MNAVLAQQIQQVAAVRQHQFATRLRQPHGGAAGRCHRCALMASTQPADAPEQAQAYEALFQMTMDGQSRHLVGDLAGAEAAFAAECAGIFARARLVTGKGTARSLFPGCYLIRQRFVVTGATDAGGAELPRFGAMLVVVLGRDGAENLTFAAVS